MKKLLFVFLLTSIFAFANFNTKGRQGIPFSIHKDTIPATVIQDTDLFKIDTVKKITDTLLTFQDTVKPKYYYGMASFYSKNLEGTSTSTQETFRHSKFTCASNRFKLNTWLRVINLSNNKSIVVRVNDRMHPRMDAKGRIVDLSIAGAKALDFINKGVTKVKVEVVDKPKKQ